MLRKYLQADRTMYFEQMVQFNSSLTLLFSTALIFSTSPSDISSAVLDEKDAIALSSPSLLVEVAPADSEAVMITHDLVADNSDVVFSPSIGTDAILVVVDEDDDCLETTEVEDR